MAPSTKPFRLGSLTWPITARQWQALSDMVEDVYQRLKEGVANTSGLIFTVLTSGFTISGGDPTSATLTVAADATVSGTSSGTNTGDQTITLTGDVTGSGTGSFVTAIGTGVIVNADVNGSAAIVDTKLATISTAGKVSNSATTATSANTVSAIVARDASGDFTATDVSLTGNLLVEGPGGHAGLTNAASVVVRGTSNGLELVNPTYLASDNRHRWQLHNSNSTGVFEFNYYTGTTSVQTGWHMNSLDGVFTSIGAIVSPDVVATNVYAATLLRGPAIQSLTAVTVTPASGFNAAFVLAGNGDFVVNTNQFYVDTSTGKVGVGVSTPDARTSIVDGASNAAITRTLRLVNPGSGTGTGAGIEMGFGDGPNSCVQIASVYDGANRCLTFSTGLGFASAPTEKVRINGAGDLSVSAGAITASGNINGNDFNVAAGRFLRWTTRSALWTPVDGQMNVGNFATTIGSQLKVDALPTVSSGFGTSPAVTAGSMPFAGSVNVGTGGTATTGVINFNGTAFPSAPFVVCMNTTTGAVVRATASATQLTITAPVAFTASDVITWICVSSK